MKRKATSFLLGLIFLVGMIGIEKQAFAGPDNWYKTMQTVIYMEGSWYIKSECTENPGDTCNMPGSIHLIKIPNFIIW